MENGTNAPRALVVARQDLLNDLVGLTFPVYGFEARGIPRPEDLEAEMHDFKPQLVLISMSGLETEAIAVYWQLQTKKLFDGVQVIFIESQKDEVAKQFKVAIEKTDRQCLPFAFFDKDLLGLIRPEIKERATTRS